LIASTTNSASPPPPDDVTVPHRGVASHRATHPSVRLHHRHSVMWQWAGVSHWPPLCHHHHHHHRHCHRRWAGPRLKADQASCTGSHTRLLITKKHLHNKKQPLRVQQPVFSYAYGPRLSRVHGPLLLQIYIMAIHSHAHESPTLFYDEAHLDLCIGSVEKDSHFFCWPNAHTHRRLSPMKMRERE
jgi:hypothetical protein